MSNALETPSQDQSQAGLISRLPPDWLDATWSALPDRSREILSRRAQGQTLAVVGVHVGLTRERVRQLETKATKVIVDAQQEYAPELLDSLTERMGEQPFLSDEEIAEVLGPAPQAAVAIVMKHLGMHRSNLTSGPLDGVWSPDPSALAKQLKALVDLMPLPDEDAQMAAASLKLPESPPWPAVLQSRYRVALTELGWIRTSHVTRDRAYLWLRGQGEPRSAMEIAEAAGTSEHATRETMRRDDAFAQVRPEGTWVLADWRADGADNRYSSAVEVVVEVLRELGPLDYNELRTECQRRYPVSEWRITQCLSSSLIGLNSAGLYDLAERGAIPVEDTEPRRPKNIQVSGEVVGVEIPVTHDVLRGSGIPVNRWLTWYLGLRTAPSSRYFQMDGGTSELTVRRATSNAQLSSLRALALPLGVVEGCKLVLLLHVDTDTAALRHACPAASCPASRKKPAEHAVAGDI